MVGQTTAVVRVDLRALAKQINAAHSAFEEGMKRSLAYAVEAGELLLKVKEELKHGEWLPWLGKNFEGSERIARYYIALSKRLPELEANRQHVADLTLRGAIKLITDSNGDEGAEPSPWTVQDVIANTKAGVVKWCERTPPDCRDLLAKCLRNLADEIDQRGGVS